MKIWIAVVCFVMCFGVSGFADGFKSMDEYRDPSDVMICMFFREGFSPEEYVANMPWTLEQKTRYIRIFKERLPAALKAEREAIERKERKLQAKRNKNLLYVFLICGGIVVIIFAARKPIQEIRAMNEWNRSIDAQKNPKLGQLEEQSACRYSEFPNTRARLIQKTGACFGWLSGISVLVGLLYLAGSIFSFLFGTRDGGLERLTIGAFLILIPAALWIILFLLAMRAWKKKKP